MHIIIIYICVSIIVLPCLCYRIYSPNQSEICESDNILFQKVRNPKSDCLSIIVLRPINESDMEGDVVAKLIDSTLTISSFMIDYMVDLRDILHVLPYSYTGYPTEDIILVMKTYNKLMNFYHGRSAKSLFINPYARYVIFLYEQCVGSAKQVKQNLIFIFRQIWKFDRILNLEFVVICRRQRIGCIVDHLRFVVRYDAFIKSKKDWGILVLIDYREARKEAVINLNGYPLVLNRFPGAMSILKKKSNTNDSEEYEGLDMMYTTTIIHKMNFTPIYR